MKAGELRHRVIIEQKQIAPVGHGDVTESWVTFADNLPAKIEPLSAREFNAAQSTQSGVDTRIKLRYLDGVLASMRVRNLDTGVIYDIAGVLPDNVSGREWITLVVSSGVNNG